jgi:hypothetical protein
MTLNTIKGAPSSHSHFSAHDPDRPLARRRNTVDSSASVAPNHSTKAAVAAIQHQFLPLLSLRQPLLNGSTTGGNLQYEGQSSTYKAISPHRRRQDSRSPERGNEHAHLPSLGGWLGNGRKSNRPYHSNPKSGPINMQGKRNDVFQPPIAGPPRINGSTQSIQSSQSMSLPSTPNYHPRHLNRVSRSPSPSASLLDSPRSAASEPATTHPHSKVPMAGCIYETLLVDARRRIPYSLGIDKLKPEKPKIERLPEPQEDSLTKDMIREFERLKPSIDSESRRRKFLSKLSQILNDHWPGHNTKVHAFGSTENHLCMDDSDGEFDS